MHQPEGEILFLPKCSMTEAAGCVQEYLDYQSARGLSAYSVHTSCAALSKTFGTQMQDYSIPKRNLCDITRSRTPAVHDAINANNSALIANRTLGLRRNELKNLRVSNFTDTGSSITMTTKGKGGKINQTVFRFQEEVSAVRELIANKSPGDYVFDRQAFKSDTDFHQSRAEALQTKYARVMADMASRPEARAGYQAEIQAAFAARGKVCREDLNKPYICRGSHRAALKQKGVATTYDRTAALYCSIGAGHFRSDVTIQHYLAK